MFYGLVDILIKEFGVVFEYFLISLREVYNILHYIMGYHALNNHVKSDILGYLLLITIDVGTIAYY